MLINEMTTEECSKVLARAPMARLGCSFENQPYVVPIYFAHESDLRILDVGQKIQWMRANPNVCVQTNEIQSASEWVSVIVSGRYQEFPEPQHTAERKHASTLPLVAERTRGAPNETTR